MAGNIEKIFNFDRRRPSWSRLSQLTNGEQSRRLLERQESVRERERWGKKTATAVKKQSTKKVETLSNKDRWRRRLNEREGEVDDFSTYKGQEMVAMAGKKSSQRIEKPTHR